MNDPIICRNCRYCENREVAEPHCLHPRAIRTDLVTGQRWHLLCSTMRTDVMLQGWLCGRDGLYFEPHDHSGS